MADVEAQRTTKGGQPAKGGDGDPAPAPSVAIYARIKDFFAKMRGGISHPPPRPAAIQVSTSNMRHCMQQARIQTEYLPDKQYQARMPSCRWRLHSWAQCWGSWPWLR